MTAALDIILHSRAAAQAGSWLKGYVFVDVPRGGISCTDLDLTFEGHEFAEIERDNDDSDDDRMSRRSDSATRTLLRVKIPVNDQSFLPHGRIESGQYQIPFSLELPSYLPGSMDFELSSSKTRCSIRYTLKAILKGSGMFWNYHKEIDVDLLAKPMEPLPPAPYSAAPVNERVNACCCFNKGSISLGGEVDDTRLFAGSRCVVNMSCRNYSTTEPHSVRARLCQEIKWNTSRSSRSKTITQTIVSVEFPSILDSIRREHQHQSRNLTEMMVQNELPTMFREIRDGIHQGTLIVPPHVLDTYSGHLITVKHRLELEVKTSCCITDPSVYIPLWIGQPAADDHPAAAGEGSYTPPATAAESNFSGDTVQVPAVIVPCDDILPVIHVPSSNVYPVASAPLETQKETVGEGEEASLLARPSAEAPSFELLIREMKGTVSQMDLVERKIRDSDWSPVWQQMTPVQFGKVMAAVQMGFDQSRVAEVVAKEIPSFGCQYVVVALRRSAEFQRASVVEALLPCCNDVEQNHTLIEGELTDWERMVTERAFASSLGH